MKIASVSPTPRKGIPMASRAIQGMDCITLAMPMTTLETFLLLVMKIPRGTAMMRARTTAKQVMARWRRNSSTRLSHSSA